LARPRRRTESTSDRESEARQRFAPLVVLAAWRAAAADLAFSDVA
jgi:hypothetical protein